MPNLSTDVVQRLRVASYNLRDFKDDIAAAARVIRAVNPDVLCLQEVPRHPLSSNRVASFAARCGLYWPAGHRGSGGTTVMSSLRVDVADTQHRSLAVAPLQRQRGYALSRVRLPGHQDIRFVSIHLSLDDAERAKHTGVILDALRADGPVVVAGDLNEGPDGPAWMAMAGRMTAVTHDAPTFPAGSPRHRLDAIFASPPLSAVAGSAVNLDRADLLAATDHLPVWVDLDLSGVVLQ